MIDLVSMDDGISGPIYRFTCKDAGVVIDQSSCAVEAWVYDEAGTLLTRRVCLPVSPKSTGQVDLMLLGRESDWDGLGKTLVVKPKIWAAVAPGGTAATNLLLNPSFDTDADVDGVADSWSLQGAKTATWAVVSDDPYPPVVFGSAQRTFHAALGQADFIQQSPSVTLNVGDILSVGCWHRCTGTPGAAENDSHAIFFRRNGGTNGIARFRVTEKDWYFVRGALVVDSAQSSAVVGVDLRGTTLDNRLDDAFAFVGEWWSVPTEARRIRIKPRNRPSKNSNQIAEYGSFEQDSNADGLADGWSKANAGTATLAIEKLTTDVYVGAASQKLTLAALSGKRLEFIHRGKFKAGDVWRASVRVKTNGALTGSPSAGQWAIQLATDPFCEDAAPVTGTAVDFGTNLATFTLYQASVTIGAETNSLHLSIWINGVTGTAWIDDCQIYRVTP